MEENILILIVAGAAMFLVIGGLSLISYHYSLGGIKSKTVGDGQHGTARWATEKEIKNTYAHVPFQVKSWRICSTTLAISQKNSASICLRCSVYSVV